MIDWANEQTQLALSYELRDVMDLIEDADVVEILLLEDGFLWAEKIGRHLERIRRMDAPIAENFLCTIASTVGSILDFQQPTIAAELGLKSQAGVLKYYRVQGVMPPVSSNPIFSIRKPASKLYSLEDYRSQEVLCSKHLSKLKEAVQDRKNILVVGGTGSGKTTLANAILAQIVVSEPTTRIVLLEDTLELQCLCPRKTSMRTNDNQSMRDLLKVSLRLRPDRIVVGEVRDAAALDLLKAWNTGHPGGLATIHANDARGGLKRLEQLIREGGTPPDPEAIAEAIDLIVFIERDPQSSAGRKISEVVEVKGFKEGFYDLE